MNRKNNLFDNKPVLANFVYLSSIQGVNLVAPLLTLPYLARVVGFEGLGILATAAATSSLLGLFIDWGFNLTATRSVSTRRDDLVEVSHIFSAVTVAKLVLIMFSFIVLISLILFVSSVSQYSLVYLFSFTFVACQALLPTWVFQGLERMATIAVINAAGKIVATVLVLLLVSEPDEVATVPLIYTFVALASVAMAIFRLHTKFGIRFASPKMARVLGVVKDGRAIFTATLAGFLYSQGPILTLNFFTDLNTVGKYSIAQKISIAAVSIFQSLSQAFFPKLSRLWIEAPERFVSLVRRYILATQLTSSAILAILFIFAPFIYLLLTGSKDQQGIEAIRYWLVVSQFTVLSVMLNPVLVSLGVDRNMAWMYVVCGSAFLVYSWALTSIFLLKGMLISMIIVEASISIASIIIFTLKSKK